MFNMLRIFKKKSLVEKVCDAHDDEPFGGRFTKCTFCGSTSFYDGPSGGASQNIECADCGARFNIHLIPGGPFLDMVIRQPQKKEVQ